MAQDLVLSTDGQDQAGRQAMIELFDAMEKVQTAGGSWVGKKSGDFIAPSVSKTIARPWTRACPAVP